MKTSLIIHPEELSHAWIDRMAEAGITVLGIHPKGGRRAPIYVREMMEMMKEREFRALIDYAHSRGLEVEYELHAASYLLPREFFAEKREFFRMNEQGERTPDLNFCVSNGEALELFANRAAELAEALYGTGKNFYFWLDDVKDSACRCPKCKGLSPSDQQLIAVNAMSRAVKKRVAGAKMAYLAYADSVTPPEKVKADKGVFLEYAPMEKYKVGAESLALFEAENISPLLAFFGKSDAKVLEYWYDNSMFSGWEKPPKRFEPNAVQIASDVRFYREKGFEYISSFACFLGEDYEKLYGEADISPFAKCVKE